MSQNNKIISPDTEVVIFDGRGEEIEPIKKILAEMKVKFEVLDHNSNALKAIPEILWNNSSVRWIMMGSFISSMRPLATGEMHAIVASLYPDELGKTTIEHLQFSNFLGRWGSVFLRIFIWYMSDQAPLKRTLHILLNSSSDRENNETINAIPIHPFIRIHHHEKWLENDPEVLRKFYDSIRA